MPPADKSVLPASVLLALGLGACTGTVSACLKVNATGDTGETTVQPCLTWGCLTGFTDSDTETGQPGTGDTGLPDTGLPDTGLPETGLPDTGLPDTGATDTGAADTGAATGDTGSARAKTRAAVFEKIELQGLLPSDVLERLKKKAL